MPPDLKEIEKQALEASLTHTRLMQLGEWGFNLFSTRKEYIDRFSYLLMQKMTDSPQMKRGARNIDVYMVDAKNDADVFHYKKLISGGRYGGSASPDGKRWFFVSTWFRIFLYREKNSIKVMAFIKETRHFRRFFIDYMQAMIHKILLVLGVMIIHSASVRFCKKTFLFIGDRGAGKSTISFKIAQEGGKIIAEDHTLVRRERGRFFASGYENLARIAQKTEKYIFEKPIPYNIKRNGGFYKKEFPLGRFFTCELYREFPIDTLIFLHKGDSFNLRKLSRQEAAIQLMTSIHPSFKFFRPGDYEEYINYFCELMESVRVFDLERGPNIEELDKIVGVLKEC